MKVYLTAEEEHILNGSTGWASQMCMKILVRLGDLFHARKLIPIGSAHVSGVSYKTLGDAPVEFLERIADSGAKVRCRATLNPQSLDDDYLTSKLHRDLRQKQLNILQQFDQMGFTPSLTCTPYYLEKPTKDSHLAWAESSAVVYANSVLEAWTNREGGPSALAAAIIGKTPDHGVHKTENRRPSILVRLNENLRNETDYGALGILLGRALADGVPAIKGAKRATESDLKQLSAALASSGMVSMFNLEDHLSKEEVKGLPTLDVESQDLDKITEEFSTSSKAKPDLIFLGCPHCSTKEIQQIARLMKDKKVRKEQEFWVCTSCYAKNHAEEASREIEARGGHVLSGVCTVVSWTEKLGIKTIMTNSAKTAYYAPTLNKAQTILAPMRACIKTAIEG